MLTGKFAQASSFVVEDIKVKGLQRISAGTVYNYLPVTVGETFSDDKQGAAIRALFNTGFFKDISLERDGGTLVVNVVERPSVAKIAIEGNKDIKQEELTEALKKIGLAEGKVYNKQILDKVEQELRRQYFSHGKYGLKIKTEVTELTRNRVGIHITISEGRVAKIKQINIVGSKAFSNDDLKGDFELSTTNFLSFYSKDDQYSKQKLSADLEKLRSYYLDRGYINFSIESTQVDITADKKEIYITINIKEGEVYTLEKVKLSGELIVDPEELVKLVKVGPGEIFSRKNATETSKAISERLGDEGYTFANVNMVPEINEQNKTVAMTFFVDPGKRVYVNRINLKGNTKTRDEVIRRELRQMESSWAASGKIERSKVRLDRLGYFEEVGVETPPVVGAADQIDVNYSIKEKASGNLQAGIGYSQVQGIIFNANISQDNIFGTGKRVNFAFNNSQVLTRYNIGYRDPYFTLDGVSLGFNAGYTERNGYQANISRYNTNTADIGFNFGIPLNEFDNLGFDVDLKNTSLSTTDYSPQEVYDFIKENNGDESFLTLTAGLGWSHDTLDKAVFPTSGGQQRLSASATVPGSDLEYYKIGYKQEHYFPLASDFTFRLLGEFAYGDGYGGTNGLPFYENYFGGGSTSVRGFRDNTLGPKDTPTQQSADLGQYPRPFGGSTKLLGKAELFFPVPFLSDVKSVRIGAFLDAGSISDGFDFSGDSRMRYSVGLSGQWLSPFGAISVSAAQPFDASGNGSSSFSSSSANCSPDCIQRFQFTFGSGF
jgi:outer membrane protein insertion porin family